jgi:hypothetical protein
MKNVRYFSPILTDTGMGWQISVELRNSEIFGFNRAKTNVLLPENTLIEVTCISVGMK